MIQKLKTLIGEKRLAKLAKVPFVAEKAGLEAHLQAACKDAAHVGVALLNAMHTAGLRPSEKDVEAFATAKAEYDAAKAGVVLQGKPKPKAEVAAAGGDK